MRTRTLGRTGRAVSVIGLGTWQLGADWGEVSADGCDGGARRGARMPGSAIFDTADVYGDGRSEKLIGEFLGEQPGSADHGGHEDGQA